MTNLSPSFSSKDIEDRLYKFWEKNKFFQPQKDSKKPPFSIILPPPNVTGSLHMGHSLVNTLQDILIRYKRMSGFNTLWLPGTDHAGISTQTVVEKHLIKKFQKRRKDFSKEEFLSHIWNWKEEKEEIILNQLQKLGCSLDWSNLRFTMDEKSSAAVMTFFKKMFDENLVYRGDYLVNWDPATQTALADDEVEYEERDSFLYYIKYPLKNSNKYVIVATTRPETLLADTALAISSKNKKHAHLKNATALLPITNREIPIIEDPFVDPNFGTGIVKITPAHDKADYEVAKRHGLPFINILHPNGSLNKNAAPFENLKIPEAREAIIKKLKKLNLLEKIEPYKLNIGLSYRSKAVIEPYLSKQWFIKMEPFKETLLQIIENEDIKIIPSFWKETYFYWIKNLKDWCISRQLWWGHQIPVWYLKKDPSKMICHIKKGLPEEVKKNPDAWYQDEDVLDTWFSSALWPFSSLGWPEQTSLLKTFYPTSILVTGHDILFFWVARMILAGEYIFQKPPFKKVFLHGLIYSKSYFSKEKDGSVTYLPPSQKAQYDLGKPLKKGIFSKWEKMSKSKGNIIDPLEIIEKYGTDAMRMALTSCTTYARQIDLDRRKFYEFQNFANKIWNASRFVLQNISSENFLSSKKFSEGLNKDLFDVEDRWILFSLNKTIEKEIYFLENFQFDKAITLLYEFFWNDFCAYYLEIVKPFLFQKENLFKKENKQKILIIVLLSSLKLLHPIAPFITEEIFQILKDHFKDISLNTQDPYTKDAIESLSQKACMISPYPKVLEKGSEENFEKIRSIIKTIRNIKAEMKIPREATDIFINFSKKEVFEKDLIRIIKTLIKTKDIFINKTCKEGSTGFLEDIFIKIPFPATHLEKEKARLKKEKTKIEKNLAVLEKKLSDKNFLEKAPKNIVDQIKENHRRTQKSLEEIFLKLKHFS